MCVFILGIDFKIKTVELQGKKIKLQIWWVAFAGGCGAASCSMAAFSHRFSWAELALSEMTFRYLILGRRFVFSGVVELRVYSPELFLRAGGEICVVRL